MPTARLGPAWALVAVGVAMSMAVIAFGDPQVGGFMLAGSTAGAAVARAVLPERLTPGLKVRSRTLDVSVYVLMVVGILVAFTQVRWGGTP